MPGVSPANYLLSGAIDLITKRLVIRRYLERVSSAPASGTVTTIPTPTMIVPICPRFMNKIPRDIITLATSAMAATGRSNGSMEFT